MLYGFLYDLLSNKSTLLLLCCRAIVVNVVVHAMPEHSAFQSDNVLMSGAVPTLSFHDAHKLFRYLK